MSYANISKIKIKISQVASTISIYLCSRKQIDMKELTSKTINWLRMALVILVLFVHVHPDHNPHWLAMDHLAGQSLGWVAFSVIGTLINKLGFIAVPLFFAISGYLFFQKLEAWSWSVWKQKLRSRVRTLLVLILFSTPFVSSAYLPVDSKCPTRAGYGTAFRSARAGRTGWE